MDIRISRTTLAVATFIVAAAFAACGRKPNGADTNVKDVKSFDTYDSHAPINLKGEILKNDSTIWGYRPLHHIDGKLIIQCWKCDHSLWVYDVRGDSVLEVGKLLPKGQGPCEMAYVNTYYDKHSQKMTFYDAPSHIYGYSVKLPPYSSLFQCEGWEKLSIPSKKRTLYYKLASLNDTLYAVVGGSTTDESDNMITLLSTNGYSRELEVPVPDDKSGFSTANRKYVYRGQAHIFYNRDKNKLYYDVGQGGYYAKIITLDERYEVTEIKDFLNDYPEYRPWNDGVNFVYTKNKSMDPYVTDERIYILPSPNKSAEQRRYKGFEDVYNDVVYVFDWDGNFVCRYLLDVPILMFVVDDGEEYLYGMTMDLEKDEEKVVRFKLKD